MKFAATLKRALLCGVSVGALALPALAQAQETGRVVGTVRDERNAIALPGVPVEVAGTGQVVYTDVDGRYVLDLTPGEHELLVALGGYQPRTITVRVAASQRTVTADVGLSMNAFTETVTVTARAIDSETASSEAQLSLRRNAPIVTDNLGGAEMKLNSDSNAAAAMQRVTGLSVVDDFVYVRGLGERYSNTTLNGAVIPTTEPDRKVVPLDLFPSGLIDNIQVVKSYVPDRSAEFAGGLVQIEPLKLPSGPTADVSWSLGFNSATTGQDVLGGIGGGRDWLGYDDGTRDLPAGFPSRKVIRGGIFTPEVGFLRPELERIGESFDNSDWTPRTRTGKPNQDVSFVLGNRFGNLGVMASIAQSYKEQFQEEQQTYYRVGGSGLSSFSDYDFNVSTQRANTGVVGNVAYQFTPNNRLSLENFYTHSGRGESRTYAGFNSDIATDIRSTRHYWIEEDLLSNSLSGDHFFQGAGNSLVEWRATYSSANRDEPDLQEALYERNGDVFVLADESQSGFRMYNTLDDATTDLALNWTVSGTQWSQLPAQYKFGVSYVDRNRDFSSRRFRYLPTGTGGIDLTESPEQLFTAGTIGKNFEFREETRVTDAYDAAQTVTGFYAMTDLSLSQTARLVGGARVENFDQAVNTFDPFDFDGNPDVIQARLENTDVFPGVNLVLAVRPDQNLRVGFSQTVNRPEFRELAPYEFTDVVGGRATVGNPSLTRALIQNVDVRWEAFPGAEEVLAASVFFKHFNDPIERIVEPTAQLRTSFTNADSARNVGLELEARRRLNDRLLVGANYTFVNSQITLAPAAAQVQTSLERPLAGQSKNLFNGILQVEGDRFTARLLYNFFGSRISDVGSLGLPDILEEGRGSLDFVLSSRFRALSIRFSADNLTDEAFEFTQGGELQRRFELGRTFAINFGLTVF